jgi:curli biogenesis system outer membrane secretion channel CsgG
MHRLSVLIALVSVTFCCAGFGAGYAAQPTAQVDNNAGTIPLPPYSGPKASVAVSDFDVKAASATYEIGSGLREMLVTALMNSNRFRVLERQVLNAVMQEQELAAPSAGTSRLRI